MSKELIVLEKLELIPFFTKGDNVDALLEQIKLEAEAHVPDASTKKGREEIKANVTKITKSKTYLEKHGKELAAEYKAIPKQIDANRKKVKDFLNEVQDNARLALTEYEDRKKEFEAEQLTKYENLKKLLATEDYFHTAYSADVLSNNLIDLQSLTIDRAGYGDYELSALKAQLKGVPDLEKAIANILKIEADIAAKQEADRIAFEQAQIEREEQVALAAKQEAERIAAWNAEQAELAAKAAIAQAETDKKAAILATKAAEEKAKQDAIDAKEREKQATIAAANLAEQARVNADIATKQAADKAEADKQAAIKAEQKRVADEEAESERLAKAREADTKHKSAINNEAVTYFVHQGLDKASAKKAVIAIAKGFIPNVNIRY